MGKLCPACGEQKSADEFYLSSRQAGGLSAYCKSCESERARHRQAGTSDEWKVHLTAVRTALASARLFSSDKECGRCGITRPKSDFLRSDKRLDGLGSECKACRSAKGAANQARYRAMAKMIPTEAVCASCGVRKPSSDFHRNAATRSGLSAYCRNCDGVRGAVHYAANSIAVNARNRANRLANPEKHKALMRRWATENPEKKAASYARWRGALVDSMVEDVDYDDILLRDGHECGICGLLIPLGQCDIDHGIPLSRGGEHSRRNLQATHQFCNRSKGNRFGTMVNPWLKWAAFAIYIDAGAKISSAQLD